MVLLLILCKLVAAMDRSGKDATTDRQAKFRPSVPK
jgi:hypothetical protein